ncbi:MAG TPA: helix-hairpin-helix domain-containing protein [Flavobacterium sp.]|uniref:ComEA family DNA-binding protein n=1 Tax=Flavobacterium sp. TaxID=239 RepID=UPI002C5C3711|nr:helix-hairpin-helix domain-containing protein [Flavobacterium sp.]HSD13467.1 helix-hairpin-helix domain-containing protein [Flavobacterium sp.]
MKISSDFKYTREQRSGIVALILLMILVQLVYCYYFSDIRFSVPSESNQEKEWLALQSEIDSLKNEQGIEKHKIYPFNPNFISDYKGYVLGMSVAEIDRLHKFRERNQFVNSVAEFQKVTKVSDKWLADIAPYFKFPDWVKNRTKVNSFVNYPKQTIDKKEKIVVADINLATQEDLMKVYGIGPALSERILKERDKLGAFVSMKQLDDVWGLSPEVISNINKHFSVLTAPAIRKLNINESSVKELSQFPFFKYQLAKEIVTYRSMNGEIKSKEDLIKIKNFPIDKVDIIALYLAF